MKPSTFLLYFIISFPAAAVFFILGAKYYPFIINLSGAIGIEAAFITILDLAKKRSFQSFLLAVIGEISFGVLYLSIFLVFGFFNVG